MSDRGQLRYEFWGVSRRSGSGTCSGEKPAVRAGGQQAKIEVFPCLGDAVEVDHIQRLAVQHDLSDHDRQAVQAHWLGRIDTALADTLERLHFKDHDWTLNSRVARSLHRHNFLY